MDGVVILRQIGVAATLAVLLGLAIYAVVIVYADLGFDGAPAPPVVAA